MHDVILDGDFAEVEADLRALGGRRILVTGGTGFVGKWLLESLAWARDRLGTRFDITVLTRDPERFQDEYPRLGALRFVRFARGDVREPGLSGSFDGIVHAATTTVATVGASRHRDLLETIVIGGDAILGIAARSGSIPVLLTSSGAVYGALPPTIDKVEETFTGAPDPLRADNAYHEGKRIAELQCALYADEFGIEPKIARMFAFVGPYLPLDAHFAIGNFLRDGFAGRRVEVSGDGRPLRSYLYATDLIAWLLAIFVRGTPMRAYNVGSEVPIDIAGLATLVAERTGAPGTIVRETSDPAVPPPRYVPSSERIRAELHVTQRVGLSMAIDRTISYMKHPDV